MNLYQRSFLKLLDFTSAEVIALLDLAAQLKSDKKNHTETQYLIGKQIALIFEKPARVLVAHLKSLLATKAHLPPT